MRIAEIIGTVTLNRCQPSLEGGTFRLAVPLGSRIALSESREAAAPFLPAMMPIDAYNAALLDHLHLEK